MPDSPLRPDANNGWWEEEEAGEEREVERLQRRELDELQQRLAEEQPWMFEEGEGIELPGGLQAVMIAAEEGDANGLREALAGLTVPLDTAGDMGDSALHLACLFGHRECVEILLAAGAPIEAKDEDGAIPLHDASAGGYTEIVGMLLARADGPEQIASMLNTHDTDGDYPLHHAARGGHADAVRLLLQAGADPGVQNVDRKTPEQLADPGSEARSLLEASCRPATEHGDTTMAAA